METGSSGAYPPGSGAEEAEVLSGARDDVRKEGKDDSAQRLSVHGDVEEDAGVVDVCGWVLARHSLVF